MEKLKPQCSKISENADDVWSWWENAHYVHETKFDVTIHRASHFASHDSQFCETKIESETVSLIKRWIQAAQRLLVCHLMIMHHLGVETNKNVVHFSAVTFSSNRNPDLLWQQSPGISRRPRHPLWWYLAFFKTSAFHWEKFFCNVMNFEVIYFGCADWFHRTIQDSRIDSE